MYKNYRVFAPDMVFQCHSVYFLTEINEEKDCIDYIVCMVYMENDEGEWIFKEEKRYLKSDVYEIQKLASNIGTWVQVRDYELKTVARNV